MSPEANNSNKNAFTKKGSRRLGKHKPQTVQSGDSASLDSELGGGRRKKTRRIESEKGRGKKWELG